MHDHDHPDGRHGRIGHNHAAAPLQWQTPHTPHALPTNETTQADLDLVEHAFVDAFPRAPDPTSFLRLAGVPFVAEDAAGRRLTLLRVAINDTADVGRLTPTLGGGHRYDPLPAKLASRRRTLALIYHDGFEAVSLTLAEARALNDLTPT